MFDYPLIYGNQEEALREPNQVVLTESTAKKYFGRTDVLGETLEMISWPSGNFKVVGVTADVPANSHLKYNVLISYETLNNQTRNDDGQASSETSWGWNDYNTYVSPTPGTDPEAFDAKFAEALYEERGEDFEKYDFRAAFPLQRMTDIHLYSDLLQESEPQGQGDGDTVFFLSMIAIFILVITWINYVNLSTAKSLERAKEVGVRKSMGAYKKQLIYQFLVESFVLNFLALAIAIVLVIVLTPAFSQLADFPLTRGFFLRPSFWGMVGVVLVVDSALSGLYPAFIMSSFRPIHVLKGKLTTNKSGIMLRRSMVIFQFAASITLIAGTIIVYQQLDHMKNLDLGFDMTDTLVVQGPAQRDSTFASIMQAFRTTLTNKPIVSQVATSTNVPGDEIFWTRGIRKQDDTPDKNFIVYHAGVDYEYFDAYDIKILAGRNYDRSLSTDTGSIMINYATMKSLDIGEPEAAIGVKVLVGGNIRTIIGVVDSYTQRSLKHEVNPLVFPLIEQSSNYITVKLASDQYQQALEEVQLAFDEYFPGAPFDSFFLDEFYNRQYSNEHNFSRTFTLFALFAIIVACLGLFGLTSFSTLQRTKEIGVRKVLGVGVSQIVTILSKEFLVLLGIANIISWPIIYLIMDGWLNNFTSRNSIGIPVFLVAAVLVLLVAIVAVGYKTLATARTNPVKALRYE